MSTSINSNRGNITINLDTKQSLTSTRKRNADSLYTSSESKNYLS